MSTFTRRIAAVALAATVAGSVAACQSQGTDAERPGSTDTNPVATPPPTDATPTAASATRAPLGDTVNVGELFDTGLREDKTVSARITASASGVTGTGTMMMDRRGEQKASFLLDLPGGGGSTGLVQVGDHRFVKLPGAQKYMALPESGTESTHPPMPGLGEAEVTARFVRTEQRDGEEMRVYTGDMRAPMSGSATREPHASRGTAWVDAKGRVRHMELTGVTVNSFVDLDMKWDFTWGKDVTIEEPPHDQIQA